MAVTTHNKIISTNLVRGPYKVNPPHLTPDDSRLGVSRTVWFPILFFLGVFEFLKYRDLFIALRKAPLGPGLTHFNPPPEGVLSPYIATHLLGWVALVAFDPPT